MRIVVGQRGSDVIFDIDYIVRLQVSGTDINRYRPVLTDIDICGGRINTIRLIFIA